MSTQVLALRPQNPRSIDLQLISPIRAAIREGIVKEARRLNLGGNEAIAKAAVEAGARFFSGYPITPSSEILEYVARHLFRYGGSYLQMEDEIGGIAAAIGASLSGVKAFTATSGPGFSLKQENLGFACITEVPLVIVNVQRAGPSTGGPTDVGQADVMQSRWGTHGDHPIIVITPYSVQECYEETIRAFNLSEKYRVPVIILTDAKVSQMKEPVLLPPKELLPIVNRAKPTGSPDKYEPFALTPDGLPPLASFGEGYRAHFTGLYHGRSGLPTKNPAMIEEQLKRIHAKLETPTAKDEILKTELFFTEDADFVVIAYGITARAAKEAVVQARLKGIKAGLLRPITLWPSDEESVLKVLQRVKKVIVAELNLGQYILEIERLAYRMSRREQKVPPPIISINRVDTDLITPEDILKELKE